MVTTPIAVGRAAAEGHRRVVENVVENLSVETWPLKLNVTWFGCQCSTYLLSCIKYVVIDGCRSLRVQVFLMNLER